MLDLRLNLDGAAEFQVGCSRNRSDGVKWSCRKQV